MKKGVLIYTNNINNVELTAPLWGRPYIEHIYEKYKRLGAKGYKVIYIVPDYQKNQPVKRKLTELGAEFTVFAPDKIDSHLVNTNPYIYGELPPYLEEDGVLGAYVQSAEKYGINTVVRVNAIYPFIDLEVLDAMVENHIANMADYTTIAESYKYAAGFYPEILELEAMKIALERSPHRNKSGKVSYYFKEMQKKSVRLNYFKLPEATAKLYSHKGLRMVLDFKSMFEEMAILFDEFPRIEDVVKKYTTEPGTFWPLPRRVSFELHNSQSSLDIETLKEILESHPYREEVFVHLIGFDKDPVEYDAIKDVLSYLKENKIKSLLETSRPDKLNELSLFDALYMVMIKYDLSQQDRIIDLARQRAKFPFIIGIDFELQHDNLSEAERIIKELGQYIDVFTFHNAENYAGHKDVVEKYRLPYRLPCRKITRELFVGADGGIRVCRARYWRKPDLEMKNIVDIWNSEVFLKLRSAHLSNNFKIDNLCNKCNMWHR